MNGLFYIGPKGGEVSFVSRDGEVLRAIALPPGAYAAASFEKLRRAGETVAFPVQVHRLCAKSSSIRHHGHYDSAANPSFRVTPAQRQAKELRGLMARSEALNRSAQKALQAVKRAKRDVPKLEHQASVQAPADAGEVSAT